MSLSTFIPCFQIILNICPLLTVKEKAQFHGSTGGTHLPTPSLPAPDLQQPPRRAEDPSQDLKRSTPGLAQPLWLGDHAQASPLEDEKHMTQ